MCMGFPVFSACMGVWMCCVIVSGFSDGACVCVYVYARHCVLSGETIIGPQEIAYGHCVYGCVC